MHHGLVADGRAAAWTFFWRGHIRDTLAPPRISISVGCSESPLARNSRRHPSHTRDPGTRPASAQRIVPDSHDGHGTFVTAPQ